MLDIFYIVLFFDVLQCFQFPLYFKSRSLIHILSFLGPSRDEYAMYNDVHPDGHRDRQPYHSPPGPHSHTSSAKPNNAFFNISPSNSPLHDEMRQGHNESYLNRKQMLSPKSSQKSYHPSKHNSSSRPDRYLKFLSQNDFDKYILPLQNLITKYFSKSLQCINAS